MVCRYFGFTADWENWGENDRMSEGWGAGKGKEFFFVSSTCLINQIIKFSTSDTDAFRVL